MLKIICASITGILFVSNVYAASSIEKKLGTFATVIKQAEVAKSVLFDGDSQQLLKKGEDLTGDALVQMQTLLLQDENYWADEPKKKCRFSPEIELSFEKNQKNVNIQFSFSCNILSFNKIQTNEKIIKNFDPMSEKLNLLLKTLFIKKNIIDDFLTPNTLNIIPAFSLNLSEKLKNIIFNIK